MTATQLTPEAQDQLRAAIDKAASNELQAQGFLNAIPDLSAVGGYKAKVVEVIDGVLGAINTLQQYAWIIPDQYEGPIQKLEDALTKVRGWLG